MQSIFQDKGISNSYTVLNSEEKIFCYKLTVKIVVVVAGGGVGAGVGGGSLQIQDFKRIRYLNKELKQMIKILFSAFLTNMKSKLNMEEISDTNNNFGVILCKIILNDYFEDFPISHQLGNHSNISLKLVGICSK